MMIKTGNGKFKILKQTKKGGIFVDIEITFEEDFEGGLKLIIPEESNAWWYLDPLKSGLEYIGKYGRNGTVEITKFLEMPTDTTNEVVEFAFIKAFQRALGIVVHFPHMLDNGEIHYV